MQQHQPKIAIIDSNTLAVMGMKQLIMSVSPVVCVDTFGCMAELEANHPEQYVHFFVAMNIVLENRSFFIQHCHRTIVLTLSVCPDKQLSDFHCLCVSVPGNDLVRSMLMMMQHGHRRNDNIAGTRPTPQTDSRSLSDREAEVMVLIVKGYINKEIADLLHIGLSTVITHRKNIMEKLGVKSVSALTIYAVMHGYVDINKI